MATITTTDLTTKTLDGTGVFDELMQTVKLHLSEEYDQNRIKGTDYSQLYLGALSATMQQSMTFLLQKQQADKQADLLAAQIVNEGLQASLITAQIAKMNADVAVAVAQEANILQNTLTEIQSTAEGVNKVLNVAAQTSKVIQDEATSAQQEANLLSEGALTAQQTLKVQKEVVIMGIEELRLDTQLASNLALTNAQVTKLASDNTNVLQNTAESQAKVNQLVKEGAKTDAEKILVDRNAANALTQNATIIATTNKVTAEKDLLFQKKETEVAQTEDNVAAGATGGVVGKQLALFTEQTLGFTRDAEQKATKILSDAWSVARSTDSTAIAYPPTASTGFDTAINKLLTGIA